MLNVFIVSNNSSYKQRCVETYVKTYITIFFIIKATYTQRITAFHRFYFVNFIHFVNFLYAKRNVKSA